MTAVSESAIASKLLEAAVRLFATKGYPATSTREIVEAAGVTKPMLYYYFQNKEGLLAAAIGHFLEPVSRAAAAGCLAAAGPARATRRAGLGPSGVLPGAQAAGALVLRPLLWARRSEESGRPGPIHPSRARVAHARRAPGDRDRPGSRGLRGRVRHGRARNDQYLGDRQPDRANGADGRPGRADCRRLLDGFRDS